MIHFTIQYNNITYKDCLDKLLKLIDAPSLSLILSNPKAFQPTIAMQIQHGTISPFEHLLFLQRLSYLRFLECKSS